MSKGLVYRIVLVVAVIGVGLFALIPTFYYDYESNESELPGWWGKMNVLPDKHLVLGLDLQGGMDLLVSVNAEEAVISEFRHNKEIIKRNFEDEDVDYRAIEVDPVEKTLAIEYPDTAAMQRGSDIIKRYFQGELVFESGEGTLQPAYKIREPSQRVLIRRAVEQVREVLARRMNTMGLQEPEIAVQGEKSIRLQLPGVKDPGRVKQQIKRSARLQFMLVEAMGVPKQIAEEQSGGPPPGMVLATWTHPLKSEQHIECYFDPASGVSSGPVPANQRLVPGTTETREGERDACYLLMEEPSVSGSDLKDARPGVDSSRLGSSSVVNFEFNIKGAREFSQLTGAHIGEPMAIVLEGSVASAPIIRDKIFARGVIEGNFSPQEATDLANVLRSGALDVSITIEEERTVGASLGADSIHKGKLAIMVGGVIVVLSMIVYYRKAGIIADLALVLNIVLIMGALSLFGATLTLPGLAGIVLTIGMAVDANVLIFERVREELRTGKTPAASIEAGYAKALWTILDANITTLIAALVLLQWGTGPIKGFAVTLTLGVLSSMFTAIIVTRVVYDLIFHYKRGARLSIGIKLQPVPARAGKGGKG